MSPAMLLICDRRKLLYGVSYTPGRVKPWRWYLVSVEGITPAHKCELVDDRGESATELDAEGDAQDAIERVLHPQRKSA